MSIKRTRNSKAFIADLKDGIGNDDLSSGSVIGLAHSQHVLAVWFFEINMWKQKFAHLCQKISRKFNSVKESSGELSSIDNLYAAIFGVKLVYKRFRNAVNLKFKHVLSQAGFSLKGSLADKKATVSIDKASEVDKIVSSDFIQIQGFHSSAHNHSIFVNTDMVQKDGVKVHRERLNNWTAKADAIVRTIQKCIEMGITRPSALST